MYCAAPTSNFRQVDLCLLALVGDGMQQARIDAAQLGEHLRIQFVALAVVRVDRPKLAGIGHDHFVTKAFKKPADPRAVRSYLITIRAVGYF